MSTYLNQQRQTILCSLVVWAVHVDSFELFVYLLVQLGSPDILAAANDISYCSKN